MDFSDSMLDRDSRNFYMVYTSNRGAYEEMPGGLTKSGTVKGYHGTLEGVNINQKLRKHEPLFNAEQQVINRMDGKMEQTKYPVALDREVNDEYFYTVGVEYDSANPLELVGKTFTDLGFVSTSYKPNKQKNTEYNFFGGRPVFMIIRVPIGTRAMLTDNTEHEVTLARGLTYKIVAVTIDRNGVPVLTVDIV